MNNVQLVVGDFSASYFIITGILGNFFFLPIILATLKYKF